MVGVRGISAAKGTDSRASCFVMSAAFQFDEITKVTLPFRQNVHLKQEDQSHVIPTREAYFERWGEEIERCAAFGYDVVRFILPDAIEQAGRIETEAVIAALENMKIETSLAKKIAFTPSHDPMVIRTGEVYWVHCLFQWQNGERVPMYPKSIKEAAGASYTFPDWPGPWDSLE